MNLTTYAETLREQLVAAAEAGGPEGRAAVERLAPGMEAAMRLALLEALSAAADEITSEMAPGSVEVRLRGGNPDFVVTLPSYEDGEGATAEPAVTPTVAPGGDEEGGTARLNLRLPEGLKAKIEEAARREGLSLNAWLVRAAAGAVDAGPARTAPRSPGSSRKYTGWVR
jgi:HicB-like protein involved in pilus formation